MTIGLTKRTTINSTTDATSYASGSFTPSASVLLVAVYEAHRTPSLDPTVPSTITGHGTWTTIHTLDWNSTVDRGVLCVFALNTGGAPGASTVTFDHGATTHQGAQASIFELTGTDVANGVAQCFVQFVDSDIDTTGGTNTKTLTLASAGDAANRPFQAVCVNENSAIAPSGTWTEIDDLPNATPPMTTEVAWRSDAFDTSAVATWTSNVRRGMFAWEVKNAVAAGGAVSVDPMGMSGFFGG